MCKAQVLTHSKGVVKFVVEAITNHLLVTRIGVVLRAFVKVGRQTLTVWQRFDSPLFRQPAVITGFRLVLEVRKESEIGFIIRTPGKRWSNSITLLFSPFCWALAERARPVRR